ncbi:MAG: Glu-tRNA(Gln) amidotransferase subunit GatE [Nitrososphaerales archaeon]
MEESPWYETMQLKVGLEMHQQLSTKRKLFCACPPYSAASGEKEESFPIRFTRLLRPSVSELGEVDLAASFESSRDIRITYLSDEETSCLVEADEEPPHLISEEALDSAIIFALALQSKIIDEIHVMRKIVVDGSNTSGFQRTAAISLGGVLDYEKGKVGVQGISLEEDAARAITVDKAEKTYALDRLGTPLIEVALDPMENPAPEDVQRAAAHLGRLMRASGRMARGLGTIRQDLNISVMNGRVVEVKGVQKLEHISKVVEFESKRQKFFRDLSFEIRKRTGEKMEISTVDVTEFFGNTGSKIIQSSLDQNGKNAKVECILVRKLGGLVGRENENGARMGKELGYIARAYGLGGVFHSDELPNYGITIEELEKLRDKIGARQDDAFVLVAGSKERVQNVTAALIERLNQALLGVPAETRAATPQGETVFLRPRPGAARMYPETDVPLISIPKEKIKQLQQMIPKSWEELVRDFERKYNLPSQLAEPLFDSERKSAFELIMSRSKELTSGFVAYALVDVLQTLSREGVPIEQLTNERLEEALLSLDRGEFAKEALPSLLKTLASDHSLTIKQALDKSELAALSRQDLVSVISAVIKEFDPLVRSKKMAAQSAIMGRVMQQVRGKIDGKIVNESVNSELSKYLEKIGID